MNSARTLALCALLTFTQSGWAAGIRQLPYPEHNIDNTSIKPQMLWLSEGISEAEAAAKAKTSAEDKILKIESVTIDGRAMYKVKLLTPDGRVRVVYIDAE